MATIGSDIIKNIPLFRQIIDDLNAIDEVVDMDKYRPRGRVTEDWVVAGEATAYHRLLYVVLRKAEEQFKEASLKGSCSSSVDQECADRIAIAAFQKMWSISWLFQVILRNDFTQVFFVHDEMDIRKGWQVAYRKKKKSRTHA